MKGVNERGTTGIWSTLFSEAGSLCSLFPPPVKISRTRRSVRESLQSDVLKLDNDMRIAVSKVESAIQAISVKSKSIS